MYNLPKEEAGNLSFTKVCHAEKIHRGSDFLNPLGCRFWHFFTISICLFMIFRYVFYGWENDLCFYGVEYDFFMVGKMDYVFNGFEYVFFMVLNVIFDFDRFW